MQTWTGSRKLSSGQTGNVQEPVEQEAPPQMRSPDGAAPAGEVTAIDETTMKEEDLQEAVGLLTQLEVRPHTLIELKFATDADRVRLRLTSY